MFIIKHEISSANNTKHLPVAWNNKTLDTQSLLLLPNPDNKLYVFDFISLIALQQRLQSFHSLLD